ncbi:hypothetical protein [Candidatus Protochlamydia phocaeensis]|uniref:hypothetical protein n=1 Tax=Candidatus Protochlamydia phocaeensis TaxID=1414722 RepID=UPI000839751A|nr:hypothetical protein [Candidatus Protochlamydia phocaeensis]
MNKKQKQEKEFFDKAECLQALMKLSIHDEGFATHLSNFLLLLQKHPYSKEFYFSCRKKIEERNQQIEKQKIVTYEWFAEVISKLDQIIPQNQLDIRKELKELQDLFAGKIFEYGRPLYDALWLKIQRIAVVVSSAELSLADFSLDLSFLNVDKIPTNVRKLLFHSDSEHKWEIRLDVDDYEILNQLIFWQSLYSNSLNLGDGNRIVYAQNELDQSYRNHLYALFKENYPALRQSLSQEGWNCSSLLKLIERLIHFLKLFHSRVTGLAGPQCRTVYSEETQNKAIQVIRKLFTRYGLKDRPKIKTQHVVDLISSTFGWDKKPIREACKKLREELIWHPKSSKSIALLSSSELKNICLSELK